MLTKVEIVNVRGDVLPLPLTDFSGGYLVKDIQGLDPVKATLTSSSMAQVDGAQPQSSRRDIRNITMKIGLEPDYDTLTVASLRAGLYDYMLTKAVIGINFFLDGALFASTTGTVESLDNNMFSADPEMDSSIICYDPDFYGPSAVTVSGSTVADSTTHTITYGGTSDAGVIFTLSVNRTIAGFSLYNTKPDGTSQTLDFVGALVSGDIVTITTIPRKKSAIKVTSGTPSSVLYGVQPAADWIDLGKGDNLFRAAVSGAAIPYTISYTPKYGAL